jgi:hypothetical protein
MAAHTLKNTDESQQDFDALRVKYAKSTAYQIAEACAWRMFTGRSFSRATRGMSTGKSSLASRSTQWSSSKGCSMRRARFSRSTRDQGHRGSTSRTRCSGWLRDREAGSEGVADYWFEIVAVLPSNFVMLMVNGSL